MAAKAKPSAEAEAAGGLPSKFLAGDNLVDKSGRVIVHKGEVMETGKGDADPEFLAANPGMVGPDASDGKACEAFRRAHGLEE